MPAKKPVVPTHRAVLATGETVDYGGAHPTHWSFGGVDGDGKPNGERPRVVPVVNRFPLNILPEVHVTDPDEYEDE